MKYAFYPALLFFLVLLSCEKDQPIVPSEPERNPDRLDFQAPVVGQSNTFEIRSYECGEEIPTTGGDLELSITAVTDEEIQFTESTGNGTPFVFSARRAEGALVISPEDRQQSQLFYFYGSDTLRLSAPPVVEVTYQDCVFYNDGEKFTGDYVASLPYLELDGKTFTDQKVVSCVPVVLSLDGYLFYDEHGLSASITVTEGGFGELTTSTTAYLLKAEGE
ncbi:hypothetical protein FUA23_00895 [Neolewinella aurantiaca]|uniref:Lipoprotein n=1 Tax=Neolewinella aurantiaca TaxID=2602767 RepID=A0A5C7FUC2_9BACT|nr:hypothetical protein [Neolewinella aurantiaca]TXF91774.1 hypothetical protein FUA23_00895 [Neolewinella aurantiaca]